MAGTAEPGARSAEAILAPPPARAQAELPVASDADVEVELEERHAKYSFVDLPAALEPLPVEPSQLPVALEAATGAGRDGAELALLLFFLAEVAPRPVLLPHQDAPPPARDRRRRRRAGQMLGEAAEGEEQVWPSFARKQQNPGS